MTDYDLNWWPPLTGSPCPVCGDTTMIRQHGSNQPTPTRYVTHASGTEPCLFPEPGSVFTTRDGTWRWQPGPEPSAVAIPDRRWLIWSHKHDSWWGPDHRGYFTALTGAGLYTKEETVLICDPLNWTGESKPHSVAVECPDWLIPFIGVPVHLMLHDAVNTATEVARTLRCVHCTTVNDDQARTCACKCVTACGSFRCTVKAADA